MCYHFPSGDGDVASRSLAQQECLEDATATPRRTAGAGKRRNCATLYRDRLEFTPQAGQPNGNKKLRQTALPTPRRPVNIAPTMLGSPPMARGASLLFTGFSKRRLGGYRRIMDEGLPRVVLSDVNCLCGNCSRVTPLEESSDGKLQLFRVHLVWKWNNQRSIQEQFLRE